MHINMEGDEFKHGVQETPPLSIRSSASSAVSRDTKWSAKTKDQERKRGKTQVDFPFCGKLEDFTVEDGGETHRLEGQGQYQKIEEET